MARERTPPPSRRPQPCRRAESAGPRRPPPPAARLGRPLSVGAELHRAAAGHQPQPHPRAASRQRRVPEEAGRVAGARQEQPPAGHAADSGRSHSRDDSVTDDGLHAALRGRARAVAGCEHHELAPSTHVSSEFGRTRREVSPAAAACGDEPARAIDPVDLPRPSVHIDTSAETNRRDPRGGRGRRGAPAGAPRISAERPSTGSLSSSPSIASTPTGSPLGAKKPPLTPATAPTRLGHRAHPLAAGDPVVRQHAAHAARGRPSGR